MATGPADSNENRKIFADLRNILVELYPLEADARTVVHQAELEVGRIEFSTRALTNWHNILAEACHSDKVESLLEVALEHYGDDNDDLVAVVRRYRAFVAQGGRLEALSERPPHQPRHPPLERIERVTPFVSREDEQADLLEKLQPGAVVSVCGTGGMGKSALTAEVIHQLASRALPRERPSENASPMASSSIPFMARGAAARSTPSSTF